MAAALASAAAVLAVAGLIIAIASHLSKISETDFRLVFKSRAVIVTVAIGTTAGLILLAPGKQQRDTSVTPAVSPPPSRAEAAHPTVQPGQGNTQGAEKPCQVSTDYSRLAIETEACLQGGECGASGRLCAGLVASDRDLGASVDACPVSLSRRMPLEHSRFIADRLRENRCLRESYSWLAEAPGQAGENARSLWLELACRVAPTVVTDGTLQGFRLPRQRCG